METRKKNPFRLKTGDIDITIGDLKGKHIEAEKIISLGKIYFSLPNSSTDYVENKSYSDQLTQTFISEKPLVTKTVDGNLYIANSIVCVSDVSAVEASAPKILPSQMGMFNNPLANSEAKSSFSLEKSKTSLESGINKLNELSTKYFGTNSLMPHPSLSMIAALYDQIHMLHNALVVKYEDAEMPKDILQNYISEIKKITLKSNCDQIIKAFPEEEKIKEVIHLLEANFVQSKYELIIKMQDLITKLDSASRMSPRV